MRNHPIPCIYFLFILGAFLLLIEGCKKDERSIPVLTTAQLSDIDATTAICGGNIISDGGSEVTARGVCWSTGNTPTINDIRSINGKGTGGFVSKIAGLQYNTAYTVRAYATNDHGTGYGMAYSFTTLPGDGKTYTDICGNIYHTVCIGTQVWMIENLKTTNYNNGAPIPTITDNHEWLGDSPAYCWYDNNRAKYGNTYGALYKCFAVQTGKLCPTGWHVPSFDEWTTLNDYLGGSYIAGGKLKEPGTAHWKSPNSGATNETGFTALPGGRREDFGLFSGIGEYGVWWSKTTASNSFPDKIYMYGMSYQNSYAVCGITNTDHYGFSVRCLRDSL